MSRRPDPSAIVYVEHRPGQRIRMARGRADKYVLDHPGSRLVGVSEPSPAGPPPEPELPDFEPEPTPTQPEPEPEPEPEHEPEPAPAEVAAVPEPPRKPRRRAAKPKAG